MILPHIRGLQEFSLLCVLGHLREARATAVRDELERRTGREISHTHVPTTLAALERKGLLRSHRIRHAGEREFPVYRLTRRGKEVLDEARAYMDTVMKH